MEVTRFQFLLDASVSYVLTNRGKIAVGHVIIGGGTWTNNLWAMIGLPLKIEVKIATGTFTKIVICGPIGGWRKVKLA